MIDSETLAEIWKNTPLNFQQQNLHYMQVASLFVIDNFPFVFKGGTCLWFFYDLPRFSEDLDFSPTEHLHDDFPEKFTSALHDGLSNIFGIKNTVVFKGYYRKDKTHAFIVNAKAPHFFPTRRSDGFTHLDIHVSDKCNVELETRPGILEHDGYDIPRKIVSCMQPAEIACEKVSAIFSRKKPRDVFDLWYNIIKFDVPFDLDMINTKMASYGKNYTRDDFSNEIDKEREGWEELSKLIFLRKKQRPSFDACKKIILEWTSSSKRAACL